MGEGQKEEKRDREKKISVPRGTIYLIIKGFMEKTNTISKL